LAAAGSAERLPACCASLRMETRRHAFEQDRTEILGQWRQLHERRSCGCSPRQPWGQHRSPLQTVIAPSGALTHGLAADRRLGAQARTYGPDRESAQNVRFCAAKGDGSLGYFLPQCAEWHHLLLEEGRAHSPAGSRAPRTLVTTIPMVNTSAAQIAAPRSCGGRAGQIQGVVSAGGCHWVCSP